MTAHTEARPRRLIHRYPLAQEVRLQIPGSAPRSYPARDVSQGGFFLATEDPFELFTDVQLVVALPGGRSATLGARVVHILPPEKAHGFGVPAGIGVQFEGLNEQQLGQVLELVAFARDNDPRPRIPRRRSKAEPNALDGEPIINYEELTVYLETNKRVGETVDVTVLRDGEELTIEVLLDERPM